MDQGNDQGNDTKKDNLNDDHFFKVQTKPWPSGQCMAANPQLLCNVPVCVEGPGCP